MTDKGYHSREGLKELDGGVWKTRITEPKPANGYLRWHVDDAARDAVYANRGRLKSGVGRDAMRRRGASPTFLIAAACAAPGCAVARTSTSDI